MPPPFLVQQEWDLWNSKIKKVKRYKLNHLNVPQRKETIAEMLINGQLGQV